VYFDIEKAWVPDGGLWKMAERAEDIILALLAPPAHALVSAMKTDSALENV
jgi:hypothetical protein